MILRLLTNDISGLRDCSPYMSADMRRMAEAFNTNVTALEDELMQLILEGQIQARIDSHNKVCFFFVSECAFGNAVTDLDGCRCRCCSPRMPTSGVRRLRNR